MASAGWDALIECKKMRKRARTYRAGADGCGASTGRVTTTGRASRDNGYAARDNGSAARDDGWQHATMSTEVLKKLGDDGYATADDGYRVRRRQIVVGHVRLGSSDDGCCSGDNG